jgi:integrase
VPAEARGHVRKLPSGKWQLRYYDREGGHRSGGAFPTKTEAWNHYRDVIEPTLNGSTAIRRDLTLQELTDLFLERHETVASATTTKTLRWRMKRPLDEFGDTRLVDLERMTDEIAGFAAKLPERFRYSVMGAFRQTCEAGVRYGHLATNPAKQAGANPMPAPRGVRVFTAEEIDRLAKELDKRGAAAIRFAAATGLRPAEWASVERRASTARGAS